MNNANHNPLKIMLLIKSLRQGGAQRQCSVLAKQLADDGHTVCIVVFDGQELFYDSLLTESVNVISLGSHRWNIPGLLFCLKRQTILFKPNILYGFLSHSNLLLVLLHWFINTKIVCGIRAASNDMNKESIMTRFGEWLHCHALNFADLVIANSHAAQNELVEGGLSQSQITVVANGIDTERFQFDHNARNEIRKVLGYTDKDRVIGLFARLHPMKGHSALLKAFSKVCSEDKSFKLLLIGSGSDVPIDVLIDEEDLNESVMLLPECRDIERYYSAIDLYCSSSLYGEGFPNALSEAMSVGLPCIATDVGDSTLILSNFGPLIAAGDVQQLTDAIRSCAAERIEVDAEARRQHIVSNFGLQLLGERTIAAIRKTLEG